VIAWTLCILAQGASEEVLVDRVAAVVNEEVITLSEVRNAAAQAGSGDLDPVARDQLRERVLDGIISERLIAQKIREADIEVTDSDVERAIQDILRQNNITEVELNQALQARSMSMSQYRADLKGQLRRLKLVDMNVRSKVSVSEKEIREEYDRRTRNAPRRERITIRHLFFRADGEDDLPSAQARAEAAFRRVTSEGEDFSQVAKEVSEGPTAAEGGSLGEMSTESLLPSLAEAVRSLQPGQVSEPIVTPNGIHVVRLDDRSYETTERYEAMAGAIREDLYNQEMEKQMQIWLEELKAGANIDRRL
jgi:peptidyl-prolyl cis-trans isomerase SurA